MAMGVGDEVRDPRIQDVDRRGVVLEVRRNPACHMRALLVSWQDGEQEELEEIEFGPLND